MCKVTGKCSNLMMARCSSDCGEKRAEADECAR